MLAEPFNAILVLSGEVDRSILCHAQNIITSIIPLQVFYGMWYKLATEVIMDKWEGLARGLAMLAAAEQPCSVCGDVHEGTCEDETDWKHADPVNDSNGRW
jgi:hypothetical protein